MGSEPYPIRRHGLVSDLPQEMESYTDSLLCEWGRLALHWMHENFGEVLMSIAPDRTEDRCKACLAEYRRDDDDCWACDGTGINSDFDEFEGCFSCQGKGYRTTWHCDCDPFGDDE